MLGLRLLLGAVALAAASHVRAGAQKPPSADVIEVHFIPTEGRKPVRLDIVHDHLLFQARLDGHDVWAMLDNGAQRTLVDTGFAKSIGLRMGLPVAQARTATGSLARRVVSDASIDLPGQVSFRSPLSAVDLSVVSKTLGRPISLIVGKDYFSILSFQIVPANRTLEVGSSGTLNVPAGTPFLVLKNDTPQLDIEIDGKPATVAVDLGADGVIGLSQAAFARLGLNDLPSVERKMVGAEGNVVSVQSVLAKRVRVGPIEASGVTVAEQPVMASDGDGHIGMGFFSRFNFAIDVNARRIWLLSPADEVTRVNQLRSAADAAVLLYKSGRETDAEVKFAELASEAKWPEELNALCWVKATAGFMLDSAVQECRDAVRLGNRNAEFVDSLGMALLQSGKLDEALNAYNEAIEKAHNAGSYMGRAIVYARMGDIAHAETDLAEAKKRDAGVEAEFAGYGLKLRSPPH